MFNEKFAHDRMYLAGHNDGWLTRDRETRQHITIGFAVGAACTFFGFVGLPEICTYLFGPLRGY